MSYGAFERDGGMIDPILVRTLEEGLYQWLDLGQADAQPVAGDFDALSTATKARDLILIWPAPAALLVELDLPVSKASQLAKALPFALEDYLADDLDRYHWVWQRLAHQGRVGVVAVARDALAACRTIFADAGLHLMAMCPEPLFLPNEAGSALFDGERCVFRFGACQGGGGERAVVMSWLSAMNLAGQSPLQIYTSTESPEIGELDGMIVQEPLSLYARHWRNALAWNLMTGEHAPPSRSAVTFKQFRPAAVLVLIAALIQLGGQWYSGITQTRLIEQYEARNQALFRATFPDVKRLVNLKAQADQQLTILENRAAADRSGFLALLHRVGSTLMQQERLRLQALAFDDAGLSIRLSADNAAGIDAWVDDLRQTGDLAVETRSMTGRQNGVEATLAIRQN